MSHTDETDRELAEKGKAASSQYRKGRHVEHRVRKRLSADGYRLLRSAGSKTPVDLIAIKPGQVLFIQVKRDGRLSADEWNELRQWCADAGAVPILAETSWRGRLRFWHLTGAKKPRQRSGLPCETFRTDEVALCGSARCAPATAGWTSGYSPGTRTPRWRGRPTPTRPPPPCSPPAGRVCPTSATSPPSTTPPSSRWTCSPPGGHARTSPKPGDAPG